MVVFYIFCALSFIIASSSATAVCTGCINIDEHSFEKILPRFEVTLLKFDNSYPYGDKHNTFSKVASDIVENKNLIIGQVGIKYYGDKDNQEFSKKFGITSQDQLPQLRLFVQGEDEPFSYSKDMPWTEEDIKKFVRDHTNIYLGLPGCLETFDKLAMKFTTSNDKKAILKEAQKAIEKLKSDREKSIAEIYTKFMNKIIESSAAFVTQEGKRLSKLLNGKVNDKKKEELQYRLNILRSFESVPSKTEL